MNKFKNFFLALASKIFKMDLIKISSKISEAKDIKSTLNHLQSRIEGESKKLNDMGMNSTAIEMNEQDVAQIISDFLQNISKQNAQEILPNWKFEIAQSLENNYEIGISYRLKKLDVKHIETCLKQIYGLDVIFVDTRPQYATERYLIVYLPVS
jgi:hypothetical protein